MSDRNVLRRLQEALYRSEKLARTPVSWVPAVDDSVMKWGNGTLSYDIWLYGNTASDYFLWDASASALSMAGAAVLNVPDGQLQLSGTAVAATAAEINKAVDVSARIVTVTTSVALTATTHGGRVVYVTATAASVITLPAASGTGEMYTIVTGAVNTGNLVIKVANTADNINGCAVICETSDATDNHGFATTDTDDTITMNATTTGGAAKGEKLVIIDVGANRFQVTAVLSGTGDIATPFSATV